MDMDETGHHHSQQTDTRIENQILHVLTSKWVLSIEYTDIMLGRIDPGDSKGRRGGEGERLKTSLVIFSII